MKRVSRVGLGMCALLVAGLAAAAWAQTPEQMIQNAPWYENELGQGVVHRYYHFDNLFSSEQDIHITDVDLSAPNVQVRFPYAPSGTVRTVSTHAANTPGAAAAVNGNFFDMSTNICVQFFRVGGTVITTTQPAVQDDAGVAVAADEAVTLLSRPGAGWASLTQPNVMATNVLLIENDVPWTTPNEPFYRSDRHPRTVLGMTDANHFLMVAIDGRRPTAAGMTFVELQTLMAALGADDAINLDGGGSTTMWGRGEPGLGVMNLPSGGTQRAVGNAVAVIADPSITFPAWDARLTGTSSYSTTMIAGDTQTVWFDFENYGTSTWTSNTHLGTTEPQDRVSPLFTAADWLSSNRPTAADQATVTPGGTGRFTFTVTAPMVSTPTEYTESFGLVEEGTGWFGPEQNRIRITVLPPGGLTGTLIVESRAGGQNNQWYTETGAWADNGTSCTALGMTPGIGMRYGSTYRSVAGLKTARFTPLISEAGDFNVYVTWGAAGVRRSPITYFVTDSTSTTEYHLDQTQNENSWVPLGTHHFNLGTGGYVEVSNEDIDVSGSMYTAAAIFEPITTAPAELAIFTAE